VALTDIVVQHNKNNNDYVAILQVDQR